MPHGAARDVTDVAHGNQIAVMQDFVYVQDDGDSPRLWILLHDPNVPHDPPPHTPGGDNMAQGSPFVFIDNGQGPIPCCREGHTAGCAHPTTGSSFCFLET
jgi:hypothetical protein